MGVVDSDGWVVEGNDFDGAVGGHCIIAFAMSFAYRLHLQTQVKLGHDVAHRVPPESSYDFGLDNFYLPI